MSAVTVTPPRAPASSQRARVVTDAVVSAYLHELARPAHLHDAGRHTTVLPPRPQEAAVRPARAHDSRRHATGRALARKLLSRRGPGRPATARRPAVAELGA